MTRALAVLRGPLGPLGRFVAAYLAGYATIAYATAAPNLILILNGVASSVALGVCVAYAPVFAEAITASTPSRGHYLGAGIFLLSGSVLGVRILSFIARDFGWPDVYNTDWMTFPLALGILGGLFHLWAPVAAAGRIPPRRWFASGVIVAVGVFTAFLAWYAHACIGGVHVPVVLR